MHLAFAAGHFDVARALLRASGHKIMEVRDCYDNTPLDLAKKSGVAGKANEVLEMADRMKKKTNSL